MTTILWTRLDIPGLESAQLVDRTLSGCAVFAHEGQPVRLDYRIVCDGAWHTQSASVHGWIGDRTIAVEIAANPWTLNGTPQPQLADCTDVDLNFSPSTNLLPIRRLNLPIGASQLVRAAWLRFPSFTLEVLEQDYRRLAEHRYAYASGSFTAEIEVNAEGLPTLYAGVWKAM